MRTEESIRTEYRLLVERCALRYRQPWKANHKGKADVAKVLGIAYATLKARLNGKGNVKSEQLLALRYVDAHPLPDDNSGIRHVDLAPPPVLDMSNQVDRMLALLGQWGVPVSANQIKNGMLVMFDAKVSIKTIQQRLSEEINSGSGRVRRAVRGQYQAIVK